MPMRTERLEVTEIAKIYALWKEYAAAINSGNMERWIALWHSDSIHLPPNGPHLCGKAEIRKHAEAQAERYSNEITINPDVVHIRGDHAFSHGTFSSLFAIVGGEINQICGKFLAVLKKQNDGAWKILVDYLNYDNTLGRDDPGTNL